MLIIHFVGSGKTFTMGTSEQTIDTEDEGITPRILRNIFDIVDDINSNKDTPYISESENKVINLKVSFLEIYNEEVSF